MGVSSGIGRRSLFLWREREERSEDLGVAVTDAAEMVEVRREFVDARGRGKENEEDAIVVARDWIARWDLAQGFAQGCDFLLSSFLPCFLFLFLFLFAVVKKDCPDIRTK